MVELFQAGRARWENLTACIAANGQRGVLESVDEVRYPVEFDPTDHPKGFPAPTAFETRNLGVSIEQEPVLNEAGTGGNLNVVVGSVTDRGTLQAEGAAARYPFQPLFEARKSTLAAPILRATHNPPGANGVNDRKDTGRTWLVFVRYTAAP